MRKLILAAFAAGSLAGFVAGLGLPAVAGGWQERDAGAMRWFHERQEEHRLERAFEKALENTGCNYPC